MDSFEDRIAVLESQLLTIQAQIIYLESEVQVLRAVFVCVSTNNRIGDMNVSEYLKESLAKRLNRNLAHLSDNEPRLATILEKILSDASKPEK